MSLKRKAEGEALTDAKKSKANSSIISFFGAPKTVSSTVKVTGTDAETTQPPQVKFDKDKWLAKLTDEQKDLLKLEIETLHDSWLAQLKDEVTSKEFLELKRFLKKEVDSGKKIFPPMEDVYSWFVPKRCPYHTHDLIWSQVPSYSPQHRQSSRHRPRPLPQLQPSPWDVLLSPTTNACPSVAQEHLSMPEERLSIIQATTQQRRPTHALGRPWRAPSQHVPNGACTRSEFTRQQGLGEVHAEGHRYRCCKADQRRCVLGLGHARWEEGHKSGSEETSGVVECPS